MYPADDFASRERSTTGESEWWYAIQAKAHQEARAESNLRGMGVEVFLPRISRAPRRAVSKHVGPQTEPLFCGYLFVRCNIHRIAHKIVYTRGVLRLLGTDGVPTMIDPSVIDLIRARLEDDGVIHIEHQFKPGEPVRITAGPLQNFIGIFERPTRASDRVAILLATVTNPMRVIVESSCVAAVS